MNTKTHLAAMEVGVVGLGLMGSSIVVALLAAGHKVIAIAPLPQDMVNAGSKISEQLHHCRESGLVHTSFDPEDIQLVISEDYEELKNCEIVFECVIEDINIKASVYSKIARQVRTDAVIATNTSAIPISVLQQLVPKPERFLGIHWAEPAFGTRFLEITCGERTRVEYAEWVFDLAHNWGKEPTLLRKDIRGFITNRLMYAVYRELFSQVEKGAVSMEDADKAFRYDAGSWITLMGVFRRMDYTGLKDWVAILPSVLPTLSNADTVPRIMQQMVESNARGTHNLKGLYTYSRKEAKEWEDAFAKFNKDIFELASRYPSVRKELQTEKSPVI